MAVLMNAQCLRFFTRATALAVVLGTSTCTVLTPTSAGDAGCVDAGDCGSGFDCPDLACTCTQDGFGLDAGSQTMTYSIAGACTDGCCNACPPNCT